MNWIKRNIFLLIGGLVALGLLGYAGYFSFARKELVDEVTNQLNAQTEELKRLTTRDPYPNESNIDSAKQEQLREAALIEKARKFFTPVSSFTNLDSAAFKNYLETTIFQLDRDAKDAGVELPAKFDFTFGPQRKRVDFTADTLVPLATRLAEIQALCEILYNARIHALSALRRIPVAKEDDGAADYLIGKKPTTNTVTGTISSPYEIVFQGFTSEIAGVLDGFAHSPHCFIVKNVDVQTNAAAGASSEGAPVYFQPMASPGAAPEPVLSPSEMMRRRYGLGRRGPINVPPPPAAAAPVMAAPVRRGPETVLNERPLKITMYIEAVTLPPAAPAKPLK